MTGPAPLVDWWPQARCKLAGHRLLAPIVASVGDEGLFVCEDFMRALVRTVCGQQVSNAAAAKLSASVLSEAGNGFADDLAQGILSVGAQGMRKAGTSSTKARALVELAQGFADGRLKPEYLSGLTNEEIVEALCSVKGIGPWSADMILIFGLGRPDVFAHTDYGVRKALERLNADQSNFDDCAPYRTAATWYLWRSLGGAPVRY